MTARDDWPVLAAYAAESSITVERAELAQALNEIDRLRALFDPEVTFRDLEMNMRNGVVDIKTLADPEIDTAAHAAGKFLAALMFRFLVDEDDGPPPNYRSGSFTVKPAGQFETMRMTLEVLTPGRPSSHDIRLQLEAKMAQARQRIESDAEMHSDTVDALLAILEHVPAPPQPGDAS